MPTSELVYLAVPKANSGIPGLYYIYSWVHPVCCIVCLTLWKLICCFIKAGNLVSTTNLWWFDMEMSRGVHLFNLSSDGQLCLGVLFRFFQIWVAAVDQALRQVRLIFELFQRNLALESRECAARLKLCVVGPLQWPVELQTLHILKRCNFLEFFPCFRGYGFNR